jgi:hypothetical protein
MQDRRSKRLFLRALAGEGAAIRELSYGLPSSGLDAYCRYQERATSRLIVDEDEKPFEAPEPEHIAAIREYIRKLGEKDPA